MAIQEGCVGTHRANRSAAQDASWITLPRTSLAQRFQMSTARSSLGAPSGCESKALMEDTGAGHEHQGRIVGDSAAIIHVIDPIENIDDLLLIEERD